ncbi:MAG TPA: hypothetical protein VKB79_02180 [Bryobacteraceae bacterium]|nr:hypothetical protein [Bryobacteraceae bacterium]
MRLVTAAAVMILASGPLRAHRLDEYLQGTLISIEKNRVQAQIALTPGVAVYPILLAVIDADHDGVISESEKRAYAGRVLHDLSLSIDGRSLTPRLLSAQFPAIEDIKEGRGEIRIEFESDLPGGGPSRKLLLQNRHQSRIAAYQVNCLVPRDSDIKVVAQRRNYTQSSYELDYTQAGAVSSPLLRWPSGLNAPALAIALLLIARLGFLWRSPARYF